jgi:Domain of unknown function DUF11
MQVITKLISNAFKRNKLISIATIFTGIIFVASMVLSFYMINQNDGFSSAQTIQPNEPTNCVPQQGSTPGYNGYPTVLNSPNLNSTTCTDIPLLSFFPVDTSNSNPRNKSITTGTSFMLSYINSATPGSASISNPTAGVEVIKESATQYRIKANLKGSNVSTLTSEADGGDLILTIPQQKKLVLVLGDTYHFPDAIERKYEADTTGRTPNDSIPDTGSVSNPLYSRFDGMNIPSSNGVSIKPNGLEAGYLGYGYILTSVAVIDDVPANTPPQIPGEEITIIRGQSGSFRPLAPTDPENDVPISLQINSPLPYCLPTSGAQAGTIINCSTDANTPVRSQFTITPTDSKGLVGTPGTFIVNVIDPDITIVKTCVKEGTQTDCANANLKPNDKVTYKIKITNTGQTPVTEAVLIDDYDESKIENVTNINPRETSINPNQGIITWNIGTFNRGQVFDAQFDATIKGSITADTIIENLARVTTKELPPKESKVTFPVVVPRPNTPNLNITKICTVKATNQPCTVQKPGDVVIYKVTIGNNGSANAEEVVLNDDYEESKIENITNINPRETSIDKNAGKITWNVGTLNVNQNKDYTFEATVKSGVTSTTVLNIAVVQGKNLPPKEARVTFEIPGNPGLAVKKSCVAVKSNKPCAETVLNPGDKVLYNLDVSNNGVSTALNVKVFDDYDQTLLVDIININPVGGVLNTGEGSILWNIGNLESGKSFGLSFNATINPSISTGVSVLNVVTAKGDNTPEVRAQVSFPVVVNPIVTTRTGGFAIMATWGVIILSGGAVFLYMKRKKGFSMLSTQKSRQE